MRGGCPLKKAGSLSLNCKVFTTKTGPLAPVAWNSPVSKKYFHGKCFRKWQHLRWLNLERSTFDKLFCMKKMFWRFLPSLSRPTVNEPEEG